MWEDPRVRAGMARQLELRRRRLDADEHHLGWKVAFGAPAAKQDLDLNAPAVGFLTDRSSLADGATVSVGSWQRPVLEPEIAVQMGASLPGGSDDRDAAAAIAGLGAALELADLDMPPDQLADVIAGNIYHRHVILGPINAVRAGGDTSGVTAEVHRNAATAAVTDDPLAMIGTTLPSLIRHVADLLDAFGERLLADDLVITGSVVPIVHVEPGDQVAAELSTLGSLSVSFGA